MALSASLYTHLTSKLALCCWAQHCPCISCPCSPVLNRCPITSALGVLGCVLWCCGILFLATCSYPGLPYSGRLKLRAFRVPSCVPLHFLLSRLRASCYKLRLRCLPDGLAADCQGASALWMAHEEDTISLVTWPCSLPSALGKLRFTAFSSQEDVDITDSGGC